MKNGIKTILSNITTNVPTALSPLRDFKTTDYKHKKHSEMTNNPNTHLLSNASKLLLGISAVYNTHWSNISKLIPDGYFDWVVDDVPYGLNVGKMAFLTEKKTLVKQKKRN